MCKNFILQIIHFSQLHGNQYKFQNIDTFINKIELFNVYIISSINWNTLKMTHNIELSKKLSWLLRHGATDKGLSINSDGYMLLDDITKLPEFSKYKLDDFQKVVDNNDKKRFSMKQENNKWYIRANQGHSERVASKINQNELLTKLTAPLPLVVHGTTYKAYREIKNSGLKKMDRSHIHFAISDDFTTGNKEQSGIRSNCQILIYLNMEKAMSDGVEFYISDNKVVLSKGIGEEGLIDKKYFDRVIDKKTNKQID